MAAYLFLNRLDEAKTVSQTAASLKHDSITIHHYLMYVAAIQKDDAAMQAQLDYAAGKPFETFFKLRLGTHQSSLGKMKLSHEADQQAADLAKKSGLTELPFNILSREAITDALYGFSASARAKAAEALKTNNSQFNRANAATAYGFLGDSSQAKKLIDQLSADHPSDSLLKFHTIPAVRALNLLHENKTADAITLLESTRKSEFGDTLDPGAYVTIYVRGLAYLQLKDEAKAAAEFQKILDHPGIHSISPYIPMAQLILARAYSLQNDSAKARIAY
jgi:tetratricopeptide (TPR) repeat protein